MSVYVSAWCWRHSKAGGSDRLVLLAIADQADDDGLNAWPSYATIAERCLISERTAQRCVQKLEEMGELAVERRAGPAREGATHQRANVYSFPAYRLFAAQEKRRHSDTSSENKEVTRRARRGDKSRQRGDTAVSADPSFDPSVSDPSKPSVAHAPATSADTADDLFTSWPGSQDLDSEDQNQRLEDQNQTTTGSDDLNGRARDERAAAPATNASHVTAAWVDAYTTVRGDDVAPTRRQVGQASRCAKELLDAGNDADRVLEAARLAGAAGYPTIDRQLAMMTVPRTYGRNGHVPYENPTDASVYLEPIQ